MSNTINRVSIGTSGSLTNIGTLSPVLMFDWIRKEITELQENPNTIIFAQALERQSDRILQIMRNAFENEEEDVSKLMLIFVANFNRNKNQKMQDIDDFVLISYYLWKLLGKVVSWKVERSDETICENSPKEQYNSTCKNDLSYNFAISKSSRKPAKRLGSSENAMDDEESLIKIPARKKGLHLKTINELDNVSSQRATSNLPNQFSMPTDNEKALNDKSEDGSTYFSGIKDVENLTGNISNVEDEDRYLRPSLREESLEDIFSNVVSKNSVELLNLTDCAVDVKRELLSGTEEEESEQVEEQMEEAKDRNSQDSIILKEEIDNEAFSINNYEHSEKTNRSLIFYDPTENRRNNSPSSSDHLPDVQQDNEQSIKQRERSTVKLLPEDDAYSEFSSNLQKSNNKLPWHMSPNFPSTNNLKTAVGSSSNDNTGYSLKIKKYRRVDYLQKQKDKRIEMKKGRNVEFCLARTAIHNFLIEEGNVFRRYNYGEEGKVHVPESTTFLRRALGHITNKGSQRHRQLTAQLQDDIKTLVSEVLLRAKQVSDQNSVGDIEIAPANRLCRISRLFVTDSMLAGVNDEVFRNMSVFRLDSNKNMALFVERLDNLRQFVLQHLSAFEFSYIFILYGFDLIHNDGHPSMDSARSLKRWFESNLVGHELQKTKEDCVYKYTIPQFVIVTLPEIGDHAVQIKEYNNELRIHVQRYGECPNGDINDFILLDWAKFIVESTADSDELAFKLLQLEAFSGPAHEGGGCTEHWQQD